MALPDTLSKTDLPFTGTEGFMWLCPHQSPADLPDWLNLGHVLAPSWQRTMTNPMVIIVILVVMSDSHFYLLMWKPIKIWKGFCTDLVSQEWKMKYVHLNMYLVCGHQTKGTTFQDFRILGALWLLLCFLMLIVIPKPAGPVRHCTIRPWCLTHPDSHAYHHSASHVRTKHALSPESRWHRVRLQNLYIYLIQLSKVLFYFEREYFTVVTLRVFETSLLRFRSRSS